MTEPRTAAAIAGDATTPMDWSEGRRRLAEAQTYWMATTTPTGAPHVRPVLGVWVDGALHVASSPRARKARNLADNQHCSFSVSADDVDVVLEGYARRVDDPAHLQRVADAYREKYGWHPVVVDGAFGGPSGAPTAGPPPYEVHAVSSSVAYGFGIDDEHAPRSARWRF